MKNLLSLTILIGILITNSYYNTFAQCSDAGVCSVGGHLVEQNDHNKIIVSASYSFGTNGESDNVKYHSLRLNTMLNLLNNTSVQFFLPYNIQTGELGTVNGIGDIILSINQNIPINDNSSLYASVGLKLATGEDNKDNLPMAYQSGLGSKDIIFALNYLCKQLTLGVGYQLAGERNDNLIQLKRGDDLLLRASYEFFLSEFKIKPQILFIKRLKKSNIADLRVVPPVNSYIDIEDSDQSQINLLTQVLYHLSNNSSINIDFAIPFIKRKVNVDGLTRTFSVSMGFLLNLN